MGLVIGRQEFIRQNLDRCNFCSDYRNLVGIEQLVVSRRIQITLVGYNPFITF